MTCLPPFAVLPAITSSALSLSRDRGGLVVLLDVDDQRFVLQVMRGDGAVDRLAVVAVVLRRHVRGDQLALARRERVRTAQQHVDELVERPGRLGRKAIGPRMPGRSGGSVMWAMIVSSWHRRLVGSWLVGVGVDYSRPYPREASDLPCWRWAASDISGTPVAVIQRL